MTTALVLLAAGLVSTLVLRGWARSLGPVSDTVPDRTPFSGGRPPTVHAWHRYHVRYYVMALVFLAFDMEMVYMYPWAVVFVREGAVALVEMAMFILILLLGMLYAWKEGALRWS